MRYTSTTNITGPAPERAISPQLRMVSVTAPSFMITVMPRLMPMIRATPNRSAQPATNTSAISLSFIRSMSPTIMPPTKNRAESSGNHHPRVGRASPISSKGTTA